MCAAGEARKANHHSVFRDPPRVTHASIRQENTSWTSARGSTPPARQPVRIAAYSILQLRPPIPISPEPWPDRLPRIKESRYKSSTRRTFLQQNRIKITLLCNPPNPPPPPKKKTESRNHEVRHLHPRPPHRRRLGPGVPWRRELLGRGLRSHIRSSQDMVSRTLTR